VRAYTPITHEIRIPQQAGIEAVHLAEPSLLPPAHLRGCPAAAFSRKY